MKLSVIIPTHDRPEVLRRTLAALENQTLPRELYEVIVVDDGSSSENRERTRDYCQDHQFQLLEKPQGGLASARNWGAQRARGEILYFLDDDVEPQRDALEQHLGSHAGSPQPVVVVGALPYPTSIRLDSFLWYMEKSAHYDLYKNPDKYPGGGPPLPPLNGNSSIARELFLRAGKYDESFRQYGGEDLELGYRLARSGARFVYNPQAIGYHHHVKSFDQFCADMEAAGESLIRIYRKYPEIKVAKKIDVVEDRFAALPARKKIVRLVLSLSLALPWLLAGGKLLIRIGGRFYGLRHLLFPLYRWVAHAHYAIGMRRGLARLP
jgi:GT2 family glycosyltransferase